MNEFNEPTVLPPFGELFADSAPSDEALARMLDVAVDPSTPDPGDSLIPGSEEVSLDEFDEGTSLDDDAVDPSDPLPDEETDSEFLDSDPLADDPVDESLSESTPESMPDEPLPDDSSDAFPDDPLADF